MIDVLNNFEFDAESGRIVGYTPADIFAIRKSITEQRLVVLKNVFAKEELLNIRSAVFDHFNSIPPSNPTIESGAKNYWRRDDNPPQSAVKRGKTR